MTTTIDMDSILANAGWEQWRMEQNDPAKRAAGAREWCTSSYWKVHTPRLECWKLVVDDLAPAPLDEDAVQAMATKNSNGLPFPAIPLFEMEQVQDFCRIVRSVDAAAALAERLEQSPQLLTFDPTDAVELCWEYVEPEVRGRIDLSAWVWLFPKWQLRSTPPPTFEGLEGLRSVYSPRRKAAIRSLEEITGRKSSRSLPGDPETQAPALKIVLKPEAAPPDLEQSSAEPVTRKARNEKLVRDLFEGTSSIRDWGPLNAAARERVAGTPEPHPLVEMTRYLREHDFPSSQDEAAWKRLCEVFRIYRDLLEIDFADRSAPLPVLELACQILATEPPGMVALQVMEVAGACRQKPEWWKAVRAALEPMSRRGGWGNPHDDWETAIRVLQGHERELDPAERVAMQAGLFSGASTRESFNGQ